MDSNNVKKQICNNCLLFNRQNSTCKVAVLIDGKEYHMPVDPGDKCHMDQLGIEISQARWWVEDENGNPTDKNGIVKFEYPVGFFGAEEKDDKYQI